MKKISLIISLGLLLSLVVADGPAQAAPERAPSDKADRVVIPDHAREISQGVFSLGVAIDPLTNRRVEGRMIIHRRDNQAKSNNARRRKNNTTCFAPLAKGAIWKNIEPWIVNATNTDGLSDDFVLGTLATGISKWETVASTDILGNGSLTPILLSADTVAPDNQNEVYFGAIEDPNTIAVTIVWGYFSGPSRFRELLEWDQVYNTAYNWSVDALLEPTKMDFDNIATHELGHSVGLADLYNSDCLAETMYGYAAAGEVNKRTLEAGDIAGINELY